MHEATCKSGPQAAALGPNVQKQMGTVEETVGSLHIGRVDLGVREQALVIWKFENDQTQFVVCPMASRIDIERGDCIAVSLVIVMLPAIATLGQRIYDQSLGEGVRGSQREVNQLSPLILLLLYIVR